MGMDDYRSRIYARYATAIQDARDRFDQRGALRWSRPYRRYLRGWLPSNPDAAILEVGCGSGNLLHLLGRLGYSDVTGVDISAEQVALARQVCPNVVQADAIELLRGRESQYDLIVGLDVVEHLRKDEVLLFLDACCDSLKPGGRLILQTPNAESPFGLGIRYGDFTHEVGFTPDSLTRLLALSGFDSIESRETGPVVHGFKSGIRWVLWQVIRVGLGLWNLAETGGRGSGVYTRVFIASAVHGHAGSSRKGDTADE